VGRSSSEFHGGVGKFYHGSDEELKPGSIVFPAAHPKNPTAAGSFARSWVQDQHDYDDPDREPYHEELAWATTHPDSARSYGKHLYEVEHVDPQERDQDLRQFEQLGRREYHASSEQGFRIIKKVP
jgi:hypothetical protein